MAIARCATFLPDALLAHVSFGSHAYCIRNRPLAGAGRVQVDGSRLGGAVAHSFHQLAQVRPSVRMCSRCASSRESESLAVRRPSAREARPGAGSCHDEAASQSGS